MRVGDARVGREGGARRRRRAAKGWMRRWTSTRDAVGKRVRLERTCRAREAVVTFEHLCGTFDGLSLAAESSSSAEEVVASAATDPRAARYLSVPLGCADVDIVVHRWGFRTLRDLGTALAMERQVFGARRECGACGGIQTGTEAPVGQRADAARSIEDVVRSMMSALRAMRAVSRARRFPLAVPRGTPAEARVASCAQGKRRDASTRRRDAWGGKSTITDENKPTAARLRTHRAKAMNVRHARWR